jgi:hypothetical protein
MAKLDPKVLGDMERRDKQIWLDLADDGDVPTLSKSLSALVEQANKSLDSIADQDKPAVVKVDAALKTRGGALILTLNSKEAALWLRRIEIEHAFTNSFSKGSSIRDRRFNIVVPRVPLIFEPDNLKHLRELEEVNGIEKHTFIKAKWIKPAARRRPDQTHAFMLLTALNAGAANIVIRDGLLICSTRVRPTKQKQEPHAVYEMSQVGPLRERLHSAKRHLRCMRRSTPHHGMHKQRKVVLCLLRKQFTP